MRNFYLQIEDGKGTVSSKWGTYPIEKEELDELYTFAFKVTTRELSNDVSRAARSLNIPAPQAETKQEVAPTYPPDLKVVPKPEPEKAPEVV